MSQTLALLFDRRAKETRTIEVGGLEDALASPDTFAWVDLEGPDPASFKELLVRLKLDLGPAADLERPEILPRIIELPDCLAFHLYEVKDPAPHLDTSGGIREIEVQRMALVISERFILTYHPGRMAAISEIERDADRSFKLWGKTPAFIAFLLLQRCLYDYAHLNLANDNYLDAMEEAVYSGDPKRLSEDVSTAGRNILVLKKLGASLQIVLMTLATKRSAFVSEDARPFYQEMFQNTVSLRAAIDSSRNLLDGIVGALQSKATERTGEVARLLTIVSVLILPLSLITGIYGMNFEYMPELRTRWGYYATLAFMAVMTTIVLVVFKRLGWLDSDVGSWRPARKKEHSAL